MTISKDIKNLIVDNYMISGVIEGCLDIPYQKLNMSLYQVELFKNDPWISSLSTKTPISKNQLMEFDKHYILDPDKQNIPYYYVINNQLIKFSNSPKWFSQKEAIKYGKSVGIKKEQLDFK